MPGMIGRKKETAQLNRLYNSGKAELVAVYGRRRVGKTFLIDETFYGKITFRTAGLTPVEKVGALQLQLDNFYHSLLDFGMEKGEAPKNWMDAFFMLERFLKSVDDGTRQLVFFDELPWMDTPRSGFITAFESFWNNWGCHRRNLMVIVCGSANSWILDQLINNHGGLYNRVTHEMKLNPFSLAECEEFYKKADIHMSRYDIVQSYMIFGGIPYYMGYFEKEKSLAQNIDDIMFAKNAKLRDEYDRLFSSAFSNPNLVKEIVAVLFSRNSGYTRKELVERLHISDGGTLTQHLKALTAGDFVICYHPFGMSRRADYYKLVDPFCLFYLHFNRKLDALNEHFWAQNVMTQAVVVWRGFAFENVCFNHIEQIKKALGIAGVVSENSAWSKREDDQEGVQIDLLISRNDNVVNMCEIKFYGGDFLVDKAYYKTILHRQEVLAAAVSKKTAVHSTLITTFGLTFNEYSGAFTNVVTLDDLFSE